MAVPSKKSLEMTNYLEANFGRSSAIREDRCTWCGGSAVIFTDALSRKEYTISGLCQTCQDEVFGGGDE